ncbi:hypothetical protein A3C98_04320 [Candidatus Roizmanbacteria bacterium RIFCSPHIGHO2_02_FULL_37_15]|uniref:Triosephosphate isomerase n=1 Tax=Candidatus Roizmanbacteria bacterium RIFCSPLOWO2_01_FULL_37_16 TaxID=1802058 RepID=A0A1F7IIP0_9BACT|nr:MAG: hypothetical protein A2859_01090 [Candidatus Roizmanbacteria bacterium RIFCSPHIGHO2_01_FULL_37_16b]OGK20717.1 MAG: hypothetical protein A3C98_04320 [Candidatus Roizmanbacteria bacterium RIFCSPHIGHO2_02_FULL_37_15]OGK33308.1 MAG: hypothetical protein A3F57_05200 [Candidatus Roizmanbacteria bacterium RIFCSPHIGHO2_12_FULL_36_11]OGK43228.1 MAG: hypothetical protein A3B40_03115 [Candidatus Roizmanbacteria bacterium RIFCSPLOWO2_01_FULL_37_16]OGK56825.1 MAG: hypothetical protein A3I50_00605 [C
MKYFIANWKANKNLDEANQWIEKYLSLPVTDQQYIVIICPPYPLLYPLKEKIKNRKNIYLGSQDLSIFEAGTYTGEVTAKSLSGLIDYSIIGHSERRKYFNESEESLFQKVHLAKKYNIKPIYCVRDENDKIPNLVQIVAYEPVYAIGSGSNEPVERVLEMKQKIHFPNESFFLYGGSVNKDNARTYLESPQIDGFLIGGTSLNPIEFHKIIVAA